MNTYGGMELKLCVFLISALHWIKWSISRSGRFIHRYLAIGTHWVSRS